jgi:hypothetical protein
MVKLLINGLHLWFQATPTAPVSRSPQYESFVVHQSSIWLGQLVFGRWPTLWATHQSSYLHRQNIRPTSTNHGTGWTRRIVTLIWTHCHKAWLDRNQALLPDDIWAQFRIRSLYDLRNQTFPVRLQLLVLSFHRGSTSLASQTQPTSRTG